MRKKHDGDQGVSGWTGSSQGRLTPADVQEKEFKVARLSTGYRMREVDEFLDQITDTLAALIAENEQLRSGAPSGPVPSPTTTDPVPPAGPADRSAVEAFLQSEKGFLQSLGGLVQGHAEELKRMVREARRPASSEERGGAEPVADEALPVPAESPRAASMEEVEEAPLVLPEGSGDEHAEAAQEAPAEAATSSAPATGSEPTDAPVTLEEPEPARSKRSDAGPEGSLRELFWGEE